MVRQVIYWLNFVLDPLLSNELPNRFPPTAFLHHLYKNYLPFAHAYLSSFLTIEVCSLLLDGFWVTKPYFFFDVAIVLIFHNF